MVRPAKRKLAHYILGLRPSQADESALDRTVRAYTDALNWLEAEAPPSQTSDLVSLHRDWYGPLRERWGLPAQMATLAMRDWAARRRGLRLEGVPYDEKLYALKRLDAVALTTIDGRVTVPCLLEGYLERPIEGAPARLVHGLAGWEFRVGVSEAMSGPSKGGMTMTTETVLARVGRVMAGMAHAAVSAAEQASPEATLEQAVREIDAAAEDVRGELGKAMAEQHRVTARLKELQREKDDLDRKIASAVSSGRDDLAETGIARQIDIEAQSAVLQRVLADADDRIAQLEGSLDAVRASRREADTRLADLRRSNNGSPAGASGGTSATARAMGRVERAQAAAERVTGVPSGPGMEDASALEDLHRLHREQQVRERLAKLKAGRP